MKFEAVIYYMNQFVERGHEVQVVSDEFEVGERSVHHIDEFQTCMISVLGSLLRKMG